MFIRVYSAFAELAHAAASFAAHGAGQAVEVPEDVSRLAKSAAAYAEKNPVPSLFKLPDPLMMLAVMVERARELPRLKCADGDAKAYRRGEAVELAAGCGWFAAMTITRLEMLCEKEGKDMTKLAQMVNTLLGPHFAQVVGKVKEGVAAAKGAERAALKAQAAAEGKAKAGALDADLVATFRDYDRAQKEEAGPQEEIAEGVLADAREEGRLLGSMGARAFLNAWRQWVKWGRPEAEAYGAKKRPRRRRQACT